MNSTRSCESREKRPVYFGLLPKRKARVAACRGRTKPLQWFPEPPLQAKPFTHATRQYTFFILLACVRVIWPYGAKRRSDPTPAA